METFRQCKNNGAKKIRQRARAALLRTTPRFRKAPNTAARARRRRDDDDGRLPLTPARRAALLFRRLTRKAREEVRPTQTERKKEEGAAPTN